MNILSITLINMKRFIKTPQIIGIMIFQVIFLGGFIFQQNSGDHKIGEVTIINYDNGSYSNSLIDKIKEDYVVSVLDIGEEEKINKEKTILLTINDGYSDSLENGYKGTVKIQGKESDLVVSSLMMRIEEFNNITLKERFIDGYNNKFFKVDNIIQNKNNNPILFIMVCYFLLMGGSTIGEETIKLKQGNVLKRAMTTANSPYSIIGGMFLGMLALQWGLTSIIYLIGSQLMDFGISTAAAIVMILAFSTLSTSLCLFTTRISKNQALASMVGIVYSIGSFAVVFLERFNTGESQIIEKIGMLFPFHWIVEIFNGGSLLLSFLMVILMSGVFFTAGGFKYKNFVNQ